MPISAGSQGAGLDGAIQQADAAEKREALQRWANHVVEGLISGTAADEKVVRGRSGSDVPR